MYIKYYFIQGYKKVVGSNGLSGVSLIIQGKLLDKRYTMAWGFSEFFPRLWSISTFVSTSCSFIFRPHFDNSLVTTSHIVPRFDVLISCWSSHFWVEMHVFQLVLMMKAKKRGIKRSTYLCLILHAKHQKSTNSLRFYLISNYG